MTLPPDPTLFLAHCDAHKAQAQTQSRKLSGQRAKNVNA